MDRKEAIEVLKKYKYVQEVQETLEYLHPELKESEDERIKKEIIEGLKHMKEKGSFVFIPSHIDSAIAWLEKQSLTENLLTVKRAYEVSPYCDNQKSAEWSEEDEKILNFVLNNLLYMLKQDHNALALYNIETKWLKSLKSRVKPLWSPNKEQLESLEKAAKHFGGCDPDDLGPNLESLYINLRGL